MRNGFALLALTVLTSAVPGQEADLEKLRQAAWMPSVTIISGIGFNTGGGYSMMNELLDPKPQIDVLRKQLQGNDSDAERYERLAKLYSRARDDKASDEAWKKAGAIYRRLLKAKPDDGLLMTRLAACLELDDPETETLLRRAVNTPSGGWQAWMGLGDCLQTKALRTLFGKGKKLLNASPQEVIALIVRQRPGQGDIDRALLVLGDARDCFDRVVAAQPLVADAHAHCGMAYGWHDMLCACLRLMTGEPVNPMAALFAPRYLVHFRRAAELTPNDFRAVGWAAFYEVLSSLLQAGPPRSTSDPLWIRLSEETRKSVSASMARLEKLAQGKDRMEAAGCAELLGTFYTFLRGDMGKGETWLRRAIEMDPARDNAWELLMGLLASRERDKEVLELGLQYLKYKDTAHTRFLAAKGYEKLKQLDQAEVQVRVAVMLSPESLEATLGLVSLLLRRSGAAGVLEQAGRVLDQAKELLKKDKTGKYQADYDVNRGIYFGLKRQRDAARRLLEGVLAKDASNRTARAALDALGTSDPGVAPADGFLNRLLPGPSPAPRIRNMGGTPAGPAPALGATDGR